MLGEGLSSDGPNQKSEACAAYGTNHKKGTACRVVFLQVNRGPEPSPAGLGARGCKRMQPQKRRPIRTPLSTSVVLTDPSDPWFVLADLCGVLDIANPSMVATRLDPLTLSQTEVQNTRGQMRMTVIVSEPGMYEVVILRGEMEPCGPVSLGASLGSQSGPTPPPSLCDIRPRRVAPTCSARASL